MDALPPRLERERKTVEAMIAIYCRAKHGARDGLCPECEELREYARRHTAKCRYGENKPPCSHCPTHCYNASHRERIREVMRFAGPKMIFRHPILAVLHMIDVRRREASADHDP